ncbi:MAG: undecaprenyl-diphosphate phosphatase [Candidatus Bathyarchaeota archaeon]|nr:MAG: undecaprenyl-diphosphate phosphatase [Candidatus Bathyarchaeota archaeon]
MLSALEAVILGVIQGLTEWLPISSSGHLAIINNSLGWEAPTIFFVLLHSGTLSVILIFFRRRIVDILRAFKQRDFESEAGRFGVLVVLGTVPTAVIGFLFQELFRSTFEDLLAVGFALLVTGILLFAVKNRAPSRDLSPQSALLIGVAQGAAIIPGISRSGATITAGLLACIKKEAAFEFSFLLSIPTIIGALVVELWNLQQVPTIDVDLIAVFGGVIVAVFVGYLSLNVLLRFVLNSRLHWFAPYCWLVGGLVIVTQILQ